MKYVTTIMISAAALLGASAASAQTGTPATDAPSATLEAPEETKVTITPEDIDNFAKAVIEVNKIQTDTSLDKDQKQAAMTAAVEKSDLDTFKFNTIVQASETNAELKQRVQLAITQQQQQ